MKAIDVDKMAFNLVFELNNLKRSDIGHAAYQEVCRLDMYQFALKNEHFEYQTAKDTYAIERSCAGYLRPHLDHVFTRSINSWATFEGYLESPKKEHLPIFWIIWYQRCNPVDLVQWLEKNKNTPVWNIAKRMHVIP